MVAFIHPRVNPWCSVFDHIDFLCTEHIKKTAEETHRIIDKLHEFDVNISEILGLRNLSAFIGGELFISIFAKTSNNKFHKNPHQDGYPDLLFMGNEGQKMWNTLKVTNRLKEKYPFSPFRSGGIEVKATIGSVPTPKQLLKKGLNKPGVGDQRIQLLTNYDWKAHHRETNNLLGIIWDFIESKPRITSMWSKTEHHGFTRG